MIAGRMPVGPLVVDVLERKRRHRTRFGLQGLVRQFGHHLQTEAVIDLRDVQRIAIGDHGDQRAGHTQFAESVDQKQTIRVVVIARDR